MAFAAYQSGKCFGRWRVMSVGRRCVADPELVNHGEDGARGLPTGSARLGPLSAGSPPTAGPLPARRETAVAGVG